MGTEGLGVGENCGVPKASDFDFCLSTSIPVLTTSTYVVAWPQGDQLLGGGPWHKANLPATQWLSLPFHTPEGAWPLSPLAFISRLVVEEAPTRPRGGGQPPPSTPSQPAPPLVSWHSSPYGLWEVEPPVAVLASTAPAASPAAAATPAAAAAAAASAAAVAAAAAATTARRFSPSGASLSFCRVDTVDTIIAPNAKSDFGRKVKLHLS